MNRNWQAVGAVITKRLRDLRITQAELAKRACVSKAIVREIQHNTIQRRRSARTLEALSIALELPPIYLATVLTGGPLPTIEPLTDPDNTLGERLDAVEQILATLVLRLDQLLTPRRPIAHPQRPPHAHQPPRPQPRQHTPHLDPRP
ncbi:helix-turn-helix domain-containing protein [Actinokineospora cianjurensis]|uniref:HTH cro/C1-type domain-containing protein n=1 Tax=Actinokineospora cianjurensis TaxID=585224 RepID=A0A421B2R0_9PSEU|nr:helix-turn-helix transcriptional regulator [Actinokineospora cianjurensis]RLK58692.1 hypothetical protein CLV68_3165 [Actinokineospora cianjurensis]